MNNETTKLFEQLAAKLGTTAEYLWTVLLKQARISAITDIIWIVISIAIAITMYAVHCKLSSPIKGHRYDYNWYQDNEGGMIVVCVLYVIAGTNLIFAISEIGNIITAFLNPEFWALNRVLDSVKKD